DADLRARSATARTPDGRDILLALAELVLDPALRDDIAVRIGQGRDAPHAVAAAFGTHRDAFAAAGGFLAERAAELSDLMHRSRAKPWCLQPQGDGAVAGEHRIGRRSGGGGRGDRAVPDRVPVPRPGHRAEP